MNIGNVIQLIFSKKRKKLFFNRKYLSLWLYDLFQKKKKPWEERVAGINCHGKNLTTFHDFFFPRQFLFFYYLLRHLISAPFDFFWMFFSLIFFSKDFRFWAILTNCNMFLSTEDFIKLLYVKLLFNMKQNRKYIYQVFITSSSSRF